jgi:Do/DeqQ family serine protease
MHHRLIFVALLTVVALTDIQAAAIPPQAALSFSPIVKKAAPAVVSISTSQSTTTTSPLFGNDPFFNFFFGGNPNAAGAPPQAREKSLGSGVIVDPSGIVVTCGHVVENAKKILVTLSDKRDFEGVVIAKDQQNDLAIIRLKDVHLNTPLPAVSFETNPVEVGDVILAIGNPFGVGQTVTSGIVSAIARSVRGRMLIQTDASINPGNSGGALISMNGNLVAIPNAILSKTGASHGIGFAIPEALIRSLLISSKDGGAIIRPWAGINVQAITSEMASTLGLQIPQGVLIKSLHPASPVLKTGIQQGDVITTINRQNISTPEEFTYQLQITPLGQAITLTILRNSQTQQVTFQPINPPSIPAPDKRRIPDSVAVLQNLEVANLSPALISEYQLPLDTPERGVVITDIGNNVLALQLKLTKGDIIEEINMRPLQSVSDLFNILPTLQKNESIKIRKGNNHITINVRP